MSAAGATCVVVDGGEEASGSSPTATCAPAWSPRLSADDPVVGGDDHARGDGVGRPHRRPDALLDMLDRGIRHLPVVSATGEGRRRRRGRRPGGRRGAHPVSPALGHRAGALASTRSCRPPRAAPDDRRAALGRAPIRCASPPCTRWWSTRSRGGSSTSPSPRSGAPRSPSPGWRWAASARREATPGSDVESAIVLQGDAPGDALIEHALAISRRVEARAARVRPAPRRARHHRDQPVARPLAGLLAARRAQLAGGPHARAGADPRLRRRRQPHSVGAAHRACRSRRRSAPPAAIRRFCASSRASRSPTARPPASCAGSSSSTPASTAAGWTSSSAAWSHRRPRAVGGDGRGGDERLDPRAPAPCVRRRHLVGRGRRVRWPTPSSWSTALRLEHQVAQLQAGQRARRPPRSRARSARSRARYLKEAFRAVASVQKRVAGELGVGAR